MSAQDDEAKKTVLAVLKHSALNMVDFKLNKRKINPDLFAKVVAAIERGDITVLALPGQLPAGTSGRYFPVLKMANDQEWYDVLVLGFTTLGTTVDQKMNAAQVIVHECTHAGFDLLKLKKMTHLEHEAAAYIAGARFVVESMIEMGGKPEAVSFTQEIEKAAWAIALVQAEGETVSTKLYNALDVAIMKHPEYKADAKKYAVNDGVGRKWKL